MAGASGSKTRLQKADILIFFVFFFREHQSYRKQLRKGGEETTLWISLNAVTVMRIVRTCSPQRCCSSFQMPPPRRPHPQTACSVWNTTAHGSSQVQATEICVLHTSESPFSCVCVCPTGVTMKLMDEVAGIVAARHCNTNVVTVAVDAINFHRKIKKGEKNKAVVVGRLLLYELHPFHRLVIQATSLPHLEGHLEKRTTAALELYFMTKQLVWKWTSVRADISATLKRGFPTRTPLKPLLWKLIT